MLSRASSLVYGRVLRSRPPWMLLLAKALQYSEVHPDLPAPPLLRPHDRSRSGPAPPGAQGAPARAAARVRLPLGHDTRAIQGWLGHRSITSTAVYTALAPNRFKDFWIEGTEQTTTEEQSAHGRRDQPEGHRGEPRRARCADAGSRHWNAAQVARVLKRLAG